MLIVPVVATYSWLQWHKCAVKKEVKSNMIVGINKKELVFFKFSNEEITSKLRWEHDSEFEYNNQMYDVVEKNISNDSTQLWCWSDYKETKLNKKLQGLLVTAFQNDSKSKDKQNEVYKFYNGLYFQPEFSWQPFIPSFYNKITICKNLIYKSVSSLISLPPPKN
jgi:hypothetical protein